MAEQQQLARRGREGARWINERPTPAEFAEWFKSSVSIHPALDVDKYVGGIVLIPGVDERSKYVASVDAQGRPVIGERSELSYTPYPRVDTRIAYFWDLVEVHDDWYGVLEPIVSERPDTSYYESPEQRLDGDTMIERVVQRRRGGPLDHLLVGLPPGFFIMSIPVGQGFTHFLGMQYRCAIYKHGEDKPLRVGYGTQQVAFLKGRREPYADPDLIAKCETSAKGRAIAGAGIFLIPGAGIATAEDMLDVALSPPPPAQQTAPEQRGPDAPQEPAAARTGAEAAADERQQLLARAKAIADELKRDFPAHYDQFGKWAQSLQPPLSKLSDARGARLRGVVTRLERMLSDAKTASEQQHALERVATEEQAAHEEGGNEAPAST